MDRATAPNIDETSHAERDETDVVVVGAGPIGLSVAAELRSRGVAALVFDRGSLGNTILRYPPGTRFFSSAKNLELAGLPLFTGGDKPSREDYLAYLRQVAIHFRLPLRLREEVVDFAGEADSFRVATRRVGDPDSVRQTHCRRVVLAVGGMEFPHRLDVPGEDLPIVSHDLGETHDYFGQRIVIIGGGNSAADAAVALARLGCPVTVLLRKSRFDSRRIKYWIYPELTGMIRRDEITLQGDATLVRFERDGVVFRDADGEERFERADRVLALVGYEPDYSLVERIGIELRGDQREPVLDEAMETTRPGVFVAGNLAAGDQRPHKIYIENGRDHARLIAERIAAEIASRSPQFSPGAVE